MKQYDFPFPNEEKGYSLFPSDLEESDNILFHGTAIENFDAIVSDGFKSAKEIGKGTNPNFLLESVSYAKTSNQCLAYVCNNRDKSNPKDGVVFVVKFDSLDVFGITNNFDDIHVNLPNIQPEIIGYCIVPKEYKFI
ncbi:hypothetical protein NMS12_003441 [Vibrio cholerae]|nr:hypothetical protein [Vibrio cholerae]EJL6739192.1 hypothetical protein [Vibrio cholerae]